MQLITSLDIGNEEIKVIVASAFDNKCNVLASTSIRSLGIKKNTIYNEKKLRESVKLAILKTEEKIGMKIKEVILLIPSNTAKMTIETGLVDIKDNIVRGSDIKRVLADAKKDTFDDTRELVSVLPISFTVDDNISVSNPIGEEGNKLFVKAVVSTSLKSEIYPLISIVSSLGISIVDIVHKSQADYYTVSNNSLDRKLGCVINMGGDVTTVSIFNKGIMIKNSYIPLGSSSVDKDISFVYKVDIKTARHLKETFALAVPRYADKYDSIDVVTLENKSITVTQSEISKVIESRLNEILKLAKNEINRLTKREISYIIVVGGISELAGFNYIVEDVLSRNASCLDMQQMGARHNKYTSAFGAIKYFYKKCLLTEEDISMFPQDVVETFLSPKKRNTGSENIVSKFLHHFYD
ncbi:MAG: cell division protein FtsA [Clostridium sp.]|nr:cell division protein FtsA [Clostridium sp.]